MACSIGRLVSEPSDRGEVVSTRGRRAAIASLQRRAGDLVGASRSCTPERRFASASEIVAGAFAGSSARTLVGTLSFGRFLQTIIPIGRAGARLTTARYFPGRTLHPATGIDPASRCCRAAEGSQYSDVIAGSFVAISGDGERMLLSRARSETEAEEPAAAAPAEGEETRRSPRAASYVPEDPKARQQLLCVRLAWRPGERGVPRLLCAGTRTENFRRAHPRRRLPRC